MALRCCIGTAIAIVALLTCRAQSRSSCYNDNGSAQFCNPAFFNVAYENSVQASNTCGTPPSKYCIRSPLTGSIAGCKMCNATNPTEAHFPNYITDDHYNKNTWWQSRSLYEKKDPTWLSIDFGKTFDITYVRIQFATPRPFSFKISKKISTDDGSPWLPYQYFSGDCQQQYGLPSRSFASRRNLGSALCTDRFSGLVPLEGGIISFSTLQGRFYDLDSSVELQEWITASALRLDLDKMNTFGDERFGIEDILRSYYFGISDVSVGGRCKCNGHAAKCERREYAIGKYKLKCKCEHLTTGDDCEKCKPLYNDKPWMRATTSNANPCARCECNGLADACVFDPVLYKKRGRGGRCLNCKNNTEGVNCEKCKVNHYRTDVNRPCEPCNCNPQGSLLLQCNTNGICQCNKEYTGKKCDTCAVGYIKSSSGKCN